MVQMAEVRVRAHMSVRASTGHIRCASDFQVWRGRSALKGGPLAREAVADVVEISLGPITLLQLLGLRHRRYIFINLALPLSFPARDLGVGSDALGMGAYIPVLSQNTPCQRTVSRADAHNGARY